MTEVPKITNFVKKKTMNWFRNVKRRPKTASLKVAMDRRPSGKQLIEQPKKVMLD